MTDAAAQRVARNTAWFTFGSIGQKLFSFLYFTIIAMAIGVGGTGRYFFALTFTALFAMAADWGISPVITREVAKDRKYGLALVRAALRCKIATILFTVFAIAIVAIIAGYPPETQRAIAMATAALVIDSIHLLGYAILRGLQRVHYEAIGTIANQVTVTVIGIIILVAFAGLRFGDAPLLVVTRGIDTIWLLVPFVFASFVNLGIALYGLIRERILEELWTIARGSWRWLLRTSTPFALTAILARVYTYSDTFILSLLAGELAVGYYSTPFKIAFAFQFIPLALIGALYPAMSEAAARDRVRLATIFIGGIRSLLIVALPIAFGIGLLADRILVVVYGSSFLPSAVPLTILAAAIPFAFVNFPAGYLLNAIDRQAINTVLIAVATAANIALNLILIPRSGVTGAAISALAATALLTIMNFVVVRHVVHYKLRALVVPLLQILVACFAMTVIVLAFAASPFGIRVALGAIAYGIVAFAVGAVRRSDFTVVAGVFRRRATVPPPAIAAS